MRRIDIGMSEDFDLNRLAAHDPAGPDPDLGELRARVLASAAEQGPFEHDERDAPRRSGRLIAGGIAAAVALLAAGTLAGVALGRATTPDQIVAVGSPDTGIAGVNPAPEMPGMPDMGPQGGAGPQVAEDAARSSTMIWPGYAEGFEPAAGLVNEAGTAAAYRLDAAGIDRAALAAQLASAFGVTGTPGSREGSTVVGRDGDPMIWVYDDAMVSWSYANPTRDPWSCPEPAPRSDGSEPGAAAPCTPSAPALDESAAREQAESILTSLGVDSIPGLEVGLDWETYSDGAITSVTAWQTLDGARTQLSWSISFDAQGPIWANGFAAGLVSAGDLPVVGARNAILRSAEPRWRAFGPTPTNPTVMPMAELNAQPAPDTSVDSPGTPNRSVSRDRITISWDPALVTAAEPTIAQYWGPGGEFWLLPGYRLSTANDRGDWVVIAVAEAAVTFTTGR